MRNQKKRRWIDPEGFYLARRRAGLTVGATADMLDVTERTIRNWENGKAAIPYAALRIVRMAAGYQLVGKDWDGWVIWRGQLWTPENRGFAQHELRYIANYLWMARQWLKEQAARRLALSLSPAAGSESPIPEVSPTVSEKASSATAEAGASPFRDMPRYFGTAASLYGKTIIGENAENTPEFRTIDALQKIAANDDSYREVL